MDTPTESYEPARTLAAVRRQQGLRQVDLAYLAGVSVGTISRIETGAVQPHKTTLAALAKVMGCGPERITTSRSKRCDPAARHPTTSRKERNES